MAKYKKGIQGPFSGKIGSVIGSSWRGIDYMRSHGKPSNKPASEKQLHQRYLFTMVNSWLSPLRDLIWIGFQIFTGTKTPMNGLVSFVLTEALTGSGADTCIDFAKVVFSRGELLVSHVKELSINMNGILNIKWEDGQPSFFCKDNDKATFVVYNPAKEQFVTFQDATTRLAKEINLQMPKTFKDDTVHCWMHYVNAEGNAVSTGVYVGEVVIA